MPPLDDTTAARVAEGREADVTGAVATGPAIAEGGGLCSCA
jgi:hypothetical protein